MKKGSIGMISWKDRYTYVKDVQFNAHDLNCPGSKFQIVKFKPGVAIASHFHKKTHEIFYIRSGTGILKLAGHEFRCASDDFFLCEPGDVHEFLNDTPEDFIILIFKTNEVEDTDIYWC